jgi:two-component system NtrC family sensor kinase
MGFIARSFNEMTSSLARITGEREALITEVRGMNNQLEQRVHEATEQLKMAHEKMLRSETLSAVGTFASGVAHELATPLSSVLSYFQTVKRSIPAEARLAEDIGIIESELTRCIGILRGMLSFARAPEMEKTVTNINAVISELLALFRYQTEYKKVTIIEELGRDVPDIVAVPGQLKQVFLNIILNALQSMTSGGELTVSTFAAGEGEGRRVAVRISDTGEGIADDEINKIFRPFYTTKKSGTGLGLALSYGIIRGHGGDIEVNNNAEKGTTFIVYLPVSLPIASNAALSKGPAGVSQT